MRRAALLVLALLAIVPEAAAQLSTLQPGDRIQLRLESRQHLTGEVITVTDDSLAIRIRPESGPIALPVEAVRRVAVSRGRESVLRSALHGALLGGGLLGVQLALDEGWSGGDIGKHAGWGAAVGSALGLTLGTLIQDELWAPVSLSGEDVEIAEALRFPALGIAGRWGHARGQAGRGSGEGVRVDAGLARFGGGTHLRAEVSAERSWVKGASIDYGVAPRSLRSEEENRRFSYGLTLVENLWRLGGRAQTYVSLGLGVTHSRVSGHIRERCGSGYPCDVDGIAWDHDSDRTHRGTYALAGVGVAARVQGVNVFADLRAEMMDDGGYEPGRFTPLSVGISF